MNPLHVEIVQKEHSNATKDHIKELVHRFLSNCAFVTPGAAIPSRDLKKQPELTDHVEAVTFCDIDLSEEVSPAAVEMHYHVHKLDASGAERDTDDATEDDCTVVEVWTLPALDFHGLWETLVYDTTVKRDTVRFVESALEFADFGVNPLIVSCNRVVLLHGPPGTGKTSLCRALAQKLAVRLDKRFPRACLVEINAHGLFSKWFAESGKLVARLLDRVQDFAADPCQLTCVLVDEVESLAHARKSAMSGLEPSDSIRAVNALLTHLDRLQRYPNVLVLTTSNVTGAIDIAFADRADVMQRVGPPSARAAFEILRGCCIELTSRGVVSSEMLFEYRVLAGTQFAESETAACSMRLWDVARSAAMAKLSARALRRLPWLAMARLPFDAQPSMQDFMDSLAAALATHLADDEAFLQEGSPSTDTSNAKPNAVNSHVST